tara:strand:+ start:1506 stop:1616 length:111 start_codon:yes stop_codon:yes gene_type:complete
MSIGLMISVQNLPGFGLGTSGISHTVMVTPVQSGVS